MAEERFNEQLGEVERAHAQSDVLALLAALESESPRVRLAAIEALGEIGGAKASIALSGVAKDRYGERPDVRLAALEALGNIFEPTRYADFLEQYVEGDNRKVTAGSRKLLQRADPDGYPGRLARLGCLDHAAIRVYGESGLTQAVPLLSGFVSERINDGSFTQGKWWGKVYAAEKALGSIGGDEAIASLEALAEAAGRESASGSFLTCERTTKIAEGARSALERARSRGPAE